MEKKVNIKNIVETTIKDVLIEGELLNENFTKVARILHGLRPNIHTLGIISAENPYGKQATKEYNDTKTLELQKYLLSGRYGYIQIDGKYGNKERSFIVNNISKDSLLQIGSSFEQESVIFAEKVDQGDYIGMKFQMIGTDNIKSKNYGVIMGEQNVFVNIGDVDDYYSEYKGRKFIIPFYGVENMVTNFDKWVKVSKQDYTDIKYTDGGRSLPTPEKTYVYRNKYTGDELSPEEYEKAVKMNENAARTSGSVAYNYRGLVKKILK